MKRNSFWRAIPIIAFSLSSLCSLSLFSAEPYIPAGVTTSNPTGWKSSNNDRISQDKNVGEILNLIGNGESSSWLSEKIPFESRKGYRLSFKESASDGGGSGCLCAGTEFFNIDNNSVVQGDVPSEEASLVFFTPDAADGADGVYNASVRFAQWNARREYHVAEPKLCAVSPIYRRVDAQKPNSDGSVDFLELGTGEGIDSDGNYAFSAMSSMESTNYDRPLYSLTASFNTDRFCFAKNNTLVYRFAFEPKRIGVSGKKTIIDNADVVPIKDGSVYVQIGYNERGKVGVEASLTGDDWTLLGEMAGIDTKTFPLTSFLNGKECEELFVRIRADESEEGKGCNLQVHGFKVSLNLAQKDERKFVGRGDTIFADLANEENSPEPDAMLWVFNDDGVWASPDTKGQSVFLEWDGKRLTKLEPSGIDMNSPVLNVRYIANVKRKASLTRLLYQYFIQNYTSEITGAQVTDGVELSWCDADYRVPQIPTVCEIQKSRPVEIYSAGNDYESFQVVLRPQKDSLRGLTATLADDLKGDDFTISKDNVQLRYAYYHYVSDPSDRTCAQGFYPDALVPMEKGADGLGAPIVVEKLNNQPIWATIKTPAGTKPGKYRGVIKITANDGDFVATVPFVVNVWNFDLPAKNHHETAFGFNPNFLWRYHNCKTEEDKRAVLEMYLKEFGDYRISPYNPTVMDPIKLTWRPDTNPPSCDVDFTAFDKEIKRVFDKYHFTNFRLDFQGLGGGTFDARYEGKAGDFKAGTPEYDSMMTDYGRKLQEHLREIGLLDAAYTYNFDEPEEKDFEFVAGEFAKIQKYMPDVSRMLTEEPTPAFEKILNDHGTSVDVWCPVSQNYSHEGSMNQRREGKRFWWYVCTAPKAPYCTEFTDHPAQELRIWLWQAFEREIVGSLVWEATYWTSYTAFGKNDQNPYVDPMCYQTGYGLADGTRRPWGNGDGRFIYPPLNAAVPGMNGGAPIFDEPNASIRWEMLRAGIQDYETLLILKNLLAEKGDKLSSDRRAQIEKLFDFSDVTTDLTHFTLNPQILLEHRRAVGQAIEELQ